MDEDEDRSVQKARQLPRIVGIRMVLRRDGTVMIDQKDLALWLSQVIDAANEDEEWVVRKIRDMVLDITPRP